METLTLRAEPVLMIAEERGRLPDDEWRYELAEGRLVRRSPTEGRHGCVVMALLWAVDRFVEEHHLGEVFPAETGFHISAKGEADTVLAPDLAYVPAGREPALGTEAYPHLAPDLVAEVAAPSLAEADPEERMVWTLTKSMRARSHPIDCRVPVLVQRESDTPRLAEGVPRRLPPAKSSVRPR